MSQIVERIALIIEAKGISNRAFEMKIGASNGMIGRAISKSSDIMSEWLSKIIEAYPDINGDWLLTGKGEIFSTKNAEIVPKEIVDNFGDNFGDIPKMQKSSPNVFRLRTDRLIDRQQIPIYDMEAVAGLVPLFTGDYSQDVVEYIETGLIPKCDGGLRIVGDSMYPLLKSGDVVFYRQINDIANNLLWGEIYLVSFDMDGDEYITVKYLNKSERKNHVILTSYNEHHAPRELHISRIRALALVKASLRVNALK